uniref:C-type lectin domain-containing protein n=1 Tax=Panagrellus redivivus TaxID=6233 RepID=A0A7E4W9R7_PANRE
MGPLAASGAILAILVLVTYSDAAHDCYLIPSRTGKCVYVLRGAEKDKCLLAYAGFEYFPYTEQDMKEVRKVLYWNDIKDKKILTGLWYKKSSNNLFFKVPSDQGNVWEGWVGISHTGPVDVNFQAAKSKDGEQVVMEITDGKMITYTMTNTKDLPLLCIASRRPELPCPKNFHIYRPTKRCFKVHMEAKTPIEAEKICKRENAIMGSINSKEEDDYIAKITNRGHVHLGMRFAWKSIEKEYPDKKTIPHGSDPALVPFAVKYMYNLDAHKIVYINFEKTQPDFNTANEFFIVKHFGGQWHDFPIQQPYSFFCATLPDQTGQT